MSEQLVHAKMLIAGKWENGQDRFDVRNPANPEEVVGTAARGTAADAERAIAAAKGCSPGLLWSRSQSRAKSRLQCGKLSIPSLRSGYTQTFGRGCDQLALLVDRLHEVVGRANHL